MPTPQHTDALNRKHARLDQQIIVETQRPIPNSLELAALKKEKLRLKEVLLQSAH